MHVYPVPKSIIPHTLNDNVFNSIIIYHHSVSCLTSGQQRLPKRVLQRVRSSVSSFNFQYLFVSFKSSNSSLRLLPRLPVPSVFPAIRRFRRQLIRKTWHHAINSRILICWSCQRMSNVHKIMNRLAKNASWYCLQKATYVHKVLVINYIQRLKHGLSLVLVFIHTTPGSCH